MDIFNYFQIGFYSCLAVAVLFFVITLILFFLFDVRSILAARSGREKARTIKEMEAVTNTTGRLVQKKGVPRSTGKLKDQKPLVTKGTVVPPSKLDDGSGITEDIKGSEETSMLGADTDQTMILGAESNQTQVLGEDRAQTSVLNADIPTQQFGEAQTTVLVSADSISEVEGVRFEIVKNIICCGTDETVE